MMRAEVLSTGDEVRTGAVVDTNAAFIAEALEATGITVQRHTCVGDDVAAIAAELKAIATRADLALVTGGLGPTEDDVTAEAAARAAGVALIEMPEALAQVERFFASRGLAMSSANRKQALMPDGAAVLENRNGSAPGFCLPIGGCRFFFLPGVPREMKSMLTSLVPAAVRPSTGTGETIHRVDVITTFGLPESVVGEKLKGLAAEDPRVHIGLRVWFPEIHVRIYSHGASAEQLDDRVAKIKAAVQKRLGKRVVSVQGAGLADTLGRMLMERNATLALAESCTGGLMAKQLTDIPGSSRFFLFSAVTYANEAKRGVLKVLPETLQRFGAVHEVTAREMAEGARRIAGADFALSTTGIAGPEGGSEQKPVGTVCIGLATPDRSAGFRYVFPFGDRGLNRRIFAATAFDRLRLYLTGDLHLNTQ